MKEVIIRKNPAINYWEHKDLNDDTWKIGIYRNDNITVIKSTKNPRGENGNLVLWKDVYFPKIEYKLSQKQKPYITDLDFEFNEFIKQESEPEIISDVNINWDSDN